MTRARSDGFSLLELLCALGVMGLVLAAGLPRLSALLPRLAADQAVRRLAGDLELARVKAIHRNTRVRTIVDVTAGEYLVEVESEGRFAAEGPARRLPPGVAFDAAESTRVSEGKISITYVPHGNTADNATIVARAGDERRRVIVSSAGRVRTE